MRIAVVGGGPAGLFFARLARRHDPSIEIEIFEQNPASATYGFGVTLAGAARDRLSRADEEVHDRLAACMVFGNVQGIELNDERILIRYAGSGGAIARLQLLEVLEDCCSEVGLVVNHEKRIENAGDLAGFDLIVGADGANSTVRSIWEENFQPRGKLLGNRYAWYGVNKALMPNALSFRMAEGGCFIGHYYAYTRDRSTFVAECDARSWTEAGLDAMSDAERKALIERVFEIELQGEALMENNSVWRRFNAVTVDNWFHDKAVLIGDALRVAHFSVGSGTRIGMDDAVALFESLKAHGSNVPALLTSFVESRKPTRDLFTRATMKSYEWYEDVRNEMQVEIADFAYNFLTRTGRVDADRLKSFAPSFYERYVESRKSNTAAGA